MKTKNIGSVFVSKWIAGTTIEDVISRCSKINKENVSAIVNYLGEDITDKTAIGTTKKTYISLIDALSSNGIRAGITVKPTQLGLLIDFQTAASNLLEIVAHAKEKGVFVWIDMEGSNHVSDTIKLYQEATKLHPDVGICIQSYLKRSIGDLEELPETSVVRLVKGAYKESPAFAFQTREETTENYLKLMGYVFRKFKRFTIATHDLDMVERALQLNKSFHRDVTFAMLLGIRNSAIHKLADEGQSATMYVPFGPDWPAYTKRRLRETGNIKILLRSLIDS